MSGLRLIVAEKPSVARDIARVLGLRGRGEGHLGDGGTRVSWCLGHLVELAEPAAYDSEWRAWRLETLPMLPETFQLSPREDSKDQWRHLRALLRDKELEEVVNACDAGREGELIFAHAYQAAGCKAPVQRLWISAMTDEAIRDGFAALRPGTALRELEDAARCRSEADWLVGLNATRAMTLRMRKPGQSLLLSLGRVQTPTLAMLTAREDEIEAFDPRPFWQVKARFEVAAGAFDATWFETDEAGKRQDRLHDEARAQEIVARCSGRAATILRAEGKRKRERPPLLYDLTSLQKEANARFGFSAKRTLDIAQSLYERKKVITYPRTDSRHLSSELVATIPERLQGLGFPPYGDTARGIHERWPVELGSRIVDDGEVSDHHAIIPTGVDPRPRDLTPEEKQVFDLVARRFLAVFLDDAVFAIVEVDVGIGDDRFAARGRTLVEAGWQAIDPPRASKKEAKKKASEEAQLPAMADGDAAETRELGTHEGKTKPPPRFTEATLLGAMERAGEGLEDAELKRAMKRNGLGTPATRAAIIETLLSRRYVERQKKLLVPTAQGRALVRSLPGDALRSPRLTGEWEARLVAIAEGRETRPDFMADIRAFATELVEELRSAEIAEEQALELARPQALDGEVLGACPRCKGEVRGGDRGWGCGGCGLRIPPVIAQREVSPRMAKTLLDKGRTKPVKGFKARSGKTFAAALVLDDEGKIVFDFPEPESLGECPACGKPVRPRGKVFTCETGRDCPFVVYAEMRGVAISEKVVKALVAAGRSGLVEGFERRDGQKESGRLVWNGTRVVVEAFDERAEEGPAGACPRCGGQVAFREQRWRCEKDDFSLPSKISSRRLRHGEVQALLKEGRTSRLHGFRRQAGTVFKAALVLDLDSERLLEFDFKRQPGEEEAPLPPGAPPPAFGKRLTCPCCTHRADPDPGYVVAGKAAWGCSKWKEGCALRVPFVVEGQQLDDADAQKLFGRQRHTRYLRGLHGPRGNLPVSRVALRPGEDPCWVLERKP